MRTAETGKGASIDLVVVALLTGGAFAAGLALGILWSAGRNRALEALLQQTERQRQAETDALLDGVKLAFADISMDGFKRIADQLHASSQAVLAGERRLQGQELKAERVELETRFTAVLGQLERLQGLVRELERDREAKFSGLETQLRAAGEQAASLQEATRRLAEALGNSRQRGQWGERLAEDVLRLAGFVEGVSYHRQRTLPNGSRPDFTFVLPQGLFLHMDVKFPFENWLRSIEATDPAGRQRHEAQFLRDVRARIAELVARSYARAEHGSLDIVLLFIPNEELAASLWRLAPGLLDEALGKGVIVVSPFTLFAVLAVVRRTLQGFRLTEAARDLADGLAAFAHAWTDFTTELDRLGAKLEDGLRSYRAVAGTRRDRLERDLAILRQRLEAADARGSVSSSAPERGGEEGPSP